MPVTSFRVLPGRDTEDGGGDAAIVLALRRRDARAELDAWNRFSGQVDGTLRRLLGPGEPRDDREDLLQEVFIRFFRRVDTLREPAAVRGFLTGICLRVVRGELAGRRRRRWLRLTTTGDAPDVGARARDDESREAVRRYYGVLEALGGQDRSIFVARTIEGLTLEDVAALHEVSVSTAQRRLARATKRVAALVRRDPLLVALAAAEKKGTP
ncbi:MAG TPA: sigma-70 family RNA polymerase sigma factor [Polyangia bacterium]|jgi:RNA polymerase sigma-70 factor (ECF subfamily)|nr:sigma-70 family RNA polymerase sigma factor [Polyangia bacterium]